MVLFDELTACQALTAKSVKVASETSTFSNIHVQAHFHTYKKDFTAESLIQVNVRTLKEEYNICHLEETLITNAASYHEGITIKLAYPVRRKYARGVKMNL